MKIKIKYRYIILGGDRVGKTNGGKKPTIER